MVVHLALAWTAAAMLGGVLCVACEAYKRLGGRCEWHRRSVCLQGIGECSYGISAVLADDLGAFGRLVAFGAPTAGPFTPCGVEWVVVVRDDVPVTTFDQTKEADRACPDALFRDVAVHEEFGLGVSSGCVFRRRLEDMKAAVKDYYSIGFYLVEGTSCVASIELHVDGSSDHMAPAYRHCGSIYAKTHTERQKLDMYSLIMAATVLYTASFAFKFPRSAVRPAKLDMLHSKAVVVPSMWVLRPYAWARPNDTSFNKKENDTYAAYERYYDDVDDDVHIEFRPSDNVEAAGRVLRDLCAKNKFCHSRPRLDMPAIKPPTKKTKPPTKKTKPPTKKTKPPPKKTKPPTKKTKPPAKKTKPPTKPMRSRRSNQRS
jgi:hypothetical protein